MFSRLCLISYISSEIRGKKKIDHCWVDTWKQICNLSQKQKSLTYDKIPLFSNVVRHLMDDYNFTLFLINESPPITSAIFKKKTWKYVMQQF